MTTEENHQYLCAQVTLGEDHPAPPGLSLRFVPIIRKGRIKGVRKGTLQVISDGRGRVETLPIPRRP